MGLERLNAEKLSLVEAKSRVDRAVNLIVERCSPESVYLFGSGAREEMTELSDLDFVVVLTDETSVQNARRKFYATRRRFGFAVDILFTTVPEFNRKAKTGGVFLVAKEDGRIVYRNKHGKA